MRVLHVIPFLDPALGGPCVFLPDIVGELTGAGVEITIATTQRPGECVIKTLEAKTVLAFDCDLSWYRYSRRLLKWLIRNVRSFDLLHIHYLFTFPSLAAARLARLYHIPYILQPHGVLNQWGLRSRRPLLKRAWLLAFERPILRNAATILYASSEEAKESSLTHASRRARILPYAVRRPTSSRTELAQSFAHKRPPNERNVMYLGRLDPKKGLELLLEAWASVVHRFPRAMLLIAGCGAPVYERSLRRLAARYGIDGHVEFLGFLSGDERWSALATADLFVLTSYSESYCIAALEAMTVGTPVLLSDRIATSDSVRAADAGLVTDCSVEGIRCALESFLADSDLRNGLAKNAFQYASRADSLQTVAEQLLNVYAKAI